MQTLRPNPRHLRIVLGFYARHSDRADHLTIDDDRHAAFKGRQQRRRQNA